MANTTAFALFIVDIKKTIIQPLNCAIRAINITHTALYTSVLVPHRQTIFAATRLEWLNSAIID
jgi:hypothetical protein